MITLGYKSKFSSILRACAAVAVGLVMIISTNATEMVKIIAAFLFAAGVVSLVYGLTHRKGGTLPLMTLNAAVDVCIGLLLFLFPSQMANLIIYLIGGVLLLFELLQLVVTASTFSLVTTGRPSILLSLVAVAGGAILLFNPFSLTVMKVIAGAALIVYGVSELLSTWRVGKAKEAYEIKFSKENVQPRETGDELSTEGISQAKEVEYVKEDTM